MESWVDKHESHCGTLSKGDRRWQWHWHASASIFARHFLMDSAIIAAITPATCSNLHCTKVKLD